MTAALFRKQFGGLRPFDDVATALVGDVKEGDYVSLDVPRQPRNAARNAYHWALLSAVVESTGKWPSAEALHYALKIHMGLVQEIAGVSGEIILRPKSTSFTRMKEPVFAAYLDRVINVICTEISPGFDPVALRQEAARRVA